MSQSLRAHLADYLALRGALGAVCRADARLLDQFVRYAEASSSGPVSAQLAVEWACSPPGRRRPAGQARRLSPVRGFLRHLQTRIPETQVPDRGVLSRGPRPQPYIYTKRDLEALIDAARSLGPQGSLRPVSYATFIGLIASCGLRAHEALRLEVSDVRLDHRPPHLLIRDTKFHKSRVVPLHPSTAKVMHEYVRAREKLGHAGSGRFFMFYPGRPISYSQVGRIFVELACAAGLRGSSGTGCRLHDLRHTFAVQRLRAWYREGADVCARLPELSVYLGHAKPEYTYWYLTATPELLGSAARRFERRSRVACLS